MTKKLNKIALIGANLTSFLIAENLLENDFNVTIYDNSEEETYYQNGPILKANKILHSFAKKYNHIKNDAYKKEHICFYNGDNIYSRMSYDNIINSLIFKFGIITTRRFVSRNNKLIKKIKRLQIQLTSKKTDNYKISTITNFLKNFKLNKLSKKSLKDYYKNRQISTKFINNFCEPILSSQYCSDSSISALSGQLQLSKIINSRLENDNWFMIDDVNSLLKDAKNSLLKNKNFSIIKNNKIDTIEIDDLVKIKVNNKTSKYDKMIITTPFEQKSVEIDNFKNLIKKRKSSDLYITKVSGEIDNSYFFKDKKLLKQFNKATFPNYILSKPNHGILFTSIENKKKNEYEIKSTRKLNDDFLNLLFKTGSKFKHTVYENAIINSESNLRTNQKQGFELVKGKVFYTSSFDSIFPQLDSYSISASLAIYFVV